MRFFNRFLSLTGVLIIVLLTDVTVCAMGQPLPKIFMVDRLVAETAQNIGNKNASDEVFILPDTGNPLSIISGKLKEKNWSEVHLFMLTKPGSMIFDELTILADNVEESGTHFREWGKLLPPGAKIIIHSDSLNSTPEGVSLVEKIAEMTGATVLVQN